MSLINDTERKQGVGTLYGNAASKRNTQNVQRLSANVILNDDLIYEVLSIASAAAGSDLQRREVLFKYALVCQAWGRAAQSLLFRHVFLQIRSSMMALLAIITQKTERGRRLSRYIRSATIKSSRSTEPFDPVGLPMIHFRHLPALLCHMPRLEELHLTLGQPWPDEDILRQLACGPQIRSLVLETSQYGPDCPVENLLVAGVNPWPQLERVALRYQTNLNQGPTHVLSGIYLEQITVESSTNGEFPEITWLSQRSEASLTHLAAVNSFPGTNSSYPFLKCHSVKNIASLTLGSTIWDDSFHNVLHSFDHLRELRLLSGMTLVRQFPVGLPDGIEHLIMPNGFIWSHSSPHHGSSLTLDRPALLKTCKLTVVYDPFAARYLYREIGTLLEGARTWAEQYAEGCREQDIEVEVNYTNKLPSTGSRPEIPPSRVRIGRPNGQLRRKKQDAPFEPTSSQLDLTDFEVILGKLPPIHRAYVPPSTRSRNQTFRLVHRFLSSLL
ncbi:hypothetical protein FRC14_006164 [Serendipita sp. 396]|nr:hypothetical protein FRC14_006164 [Serendipita sp. 396]KAG8779393.1 hypothetical protein FRC15_010219 [Serendipita sp. 397]KAG8866599.1 hypothetical protein FRC20_008046 [Serendipita sp. 405]